MPIVTVIMSAYNSSATIVKAISSIQNQTFKDWELIICDDFSSDTTVKLIKEVQESDNRIRLIRNDKNMFAAYSRNRCIEQAAGEYIVVQDSDDYSHSERLKICVDYLSNNDNVSFVSTSAYFFDNSGIWGKRILQDGIKDKNDLISGLCFIHGATTFRKICLENVGSYRVSKETRRGQDYDLFMRIYSYGSFGATLSTKLYYIKETEDDYKRRKLKYRIDEARIRFLGYRSMQINKVYYVFVLKPIIVGLIPNTLMLGLKKTVNKFLTR